MADKRATIPHARLDRIESNVRYTKRHPVDGAMLSRFGYDHGHLLIIDSKGKHDLLADRESHPLVCDAARILHEVSPDIIDELVRGYRLAKAAGILGDSEPALTEVEELYADGASFRVTGQAIYDGIKRAQRRPGGFRV